VSISDVEMQAFSLRFVMLFKIYTIYINNNQQIFTPSNKLLDFSTFSLWHGCCSMAVIMHRKCAKAGSEYSSPLFLFLNVAVPGVYEVIDSHLTVDSEEMSGYLNEKE
jgi:hypothetical protein